MSATTSSQRPRSSMKVLIGCSSYPPYVQGGGEISTRLMAEGLHDAGCDVAVLTVSDTPSHEVETRRGVRIHRIPSPNTYWSYQSDQYGALRKSIWHLREAYNWSVRQYVQAIFDEESPDIFHTSTIEDLSPFVWKVAQDNGLTVIHTLRSYTLLCPHRNMFRRGTPCSGQCLDCKLVTAPKRYLSKHVDVVHGISSFILEVHREHGYFPQGRTCVIPNIYDLQSDVRREPAEHVRFGYIGRLHPTKGVHQLIKEAKPVLKAGVATLDIAGTGPDSYTECLNKAGRGEPIEFLGYTDASDFYSHTDVVVVPSLWHEPFGRVIIEAYAHGCPVVATYRGGISELVSTNDGWLYDPNQEGRLQEILQSIVRRPELIEEKREGRSGEKVKKYEKETVINKIVSMYRKSLNKDES